MVQRDISPNNNLEKQARETQELASEKEKSYYKFSNCWFDKEKDLLWTKWDSKMFTLHHCMCIKPFVYW